MYGNVYSGQSGVSMFYITISNGLLEDGHHERMGAAIWLFMWFIDKVTKIDSKGFGWVYGGKPININSISHIPRRTVQRYLQTLKKEGYVDTIRTPYGIIVKVVKAKKKFGDAPKVAHPDAPKMVQRCAKNGTRYTKSGASNKTIQDNTKTGGEKNLSIKIEKQKNMKKNRMGKYKENDHNDYETSIDLESGEIIADEHESTAERNRKKREMVDWLITHQKRDPLRTNRPAQLKALNTLIEMNVPPNKIRDVIFECEESEFWKGRKEKPDFNTVVKIIQKRG